MNRMMDGIRFITPYTIAIGLASLLYLLLSPIVYKIRRRNQQQSLDGVQLIADPQDARFEIVAIPGLGANPELTWGKVSFSKGTLENRKEAASSSEALHLLRSLLANDFKKARIFSFAHNSDWLVDAPVGSAYKHGQSLIQGLRDIRRDRPKLPIIFIGHSFGGIIIKQAFRNLELKDDILKHSAGVIFLGTPHQGSSAAFWGRLLASLTRFLGSDNSLLLSLQTEHASLDELEDDFRKRIDPARVECFYETKPTYLFGWFSIGLIVTQASAFGMATSRKAMNTDHSGLIKFRSSNDNNYTKLKNSINAFIPSDKPYEYICNNFYTGNRLKIERLSGEPLPMDQCYINLAIVTPLKQDTQLTNSPFSLSNRLKVVTPPEESQVELPTLFYSREGIKAPKRILIRGSAGVGKTTLCKKIVHDFIHGIIWKELFDRVIWVPLRDLKAPTKMRNLQDMFSHIYFPDPDGPDRSRVLWEAMKGNEYCSKSLFILDGLDEVSELFKTPLLMELLNQPSVIITARPHVILPYGVDKIDIDFETVGFYPDQVENYLEKVVKDSIKVNEIQSFLRQRWVLESLVRIPVQLDALCLIWGENALDDSILETMTDVYKAISEKLWRKDIERLKRLPNDEIHQALSHEIEHHTKHETTFLQQLAFTGICNNMIEFNYKHRNRIIELVKPKEGHSLDALLEKLSFLRTSDPSTHMPKRSYHFLHLTYQEFFAAQYFAQQWSSGSKLNYLNLQSNESDVSGIEPIEFLQQNKYDSRYDLVWRFTVGLLPRTEITKFFDQIEKGPVDLLGPAHQRLIMHCLSETTDLQSRSCLNEKLKQWILFECDFNYISLLVGASDFPAEALQNALDGCTISRKLLILQSLAYSGRYLSDKTVKLLENLINHEDDYVKCAALEALANSSTLPERMITRLLPLLEYGIGGSGPDVGFRAASTIGAQLRLSENTISALVALIRGRTQGSQNGATVFEYQLHIPENTIELLLEIFNDISKDIGNKEDRYEISAHDALKNITDSLKNQRNLPERNVTTIVSLLNNTDTQKYAAQILSNQSNVSEQIATAFIGLLGGGKDSREVANQYLKDKTTLPKGSAEALVQLLRGADEDAMEAATTILALQSSLSEKIKTSLRELSESTDIGTQCFAAVALKQSDLPNQNITALLHLLENSIGKLGASAARVLRQQSFLSEPTTMALVALIRNGGPNARERAAKVLGMQSNLSEHCVAALIQLLQDADFEIRDKAFEALEGQLSLPEQAIKDITSLLKNGNRYTREKAALTLAQQSQWPNETIIAVALMLGDIEETAQLHNAQALGKYSSLPKVAIEVLTQLLESTDENHQLAAATALRGIPNLSEKVTTVLITLLKCGRKNVQLDAAAVLEKRPQLSDEVTIALASLLKDEDWDIQQRIRHILEERPNLSEKTVQTLVPALTVTYSYLFNAANILARQSRLSEETATSILAFLKDSDYDIRARLSEEIVRNSILLDKILQALGLLDDSKEPAGDMESQLDSLELLYGSLIYRSLHEQYCLLIDEDLTLYMSRPDGSKTAMLKLPSLDVVFKWQETWKCPSMDYIKRS